MKKHSIKNFIQTINSLFLLLLVVGCGRQPSPSLYIKPSVYDMTQSQTLKVDKYRGTESFVSYESDGGHTDYFRPSRAPGPFNTEAFDIYPENSQLNYSSDGSFSFTPPLDFNGIARFKIRWRESDLRAEAVNPKIYSRGKVPADYSSRRFSVSLRRADPNNLRSWYIVDHDQPFDDVWTDVIIFVKKSTSQSPAETSNKQSLFNEELWTKRSKVYSSYLKYDTGSKYGFGIERQFFKSKFYLEDEQFLIASFDSPLRYVNSQQSLVFTDLFEVNQNQTKADNIRTSGLLLDKFLYENVSADITWSDSANGDYPQFDLTVKSDVYEHADEQTQNQIDFVTLGNNLNFYRSEDSGLVHTKMGTFYPGIFPIPNLDYAAKVDKGLPNNSELEEDSIYHYFTFTGSDTFKISTYLSGTDLQWTDESEDLQFALLDNELQPGIFGTEVLEQSGNLRGIAFEKVKAILTYSDDFNRCYLDLATDSLHLDENLPSESVVEELLSKNVAYITEENDILVHRLGPFSTIHGYEDFTATNTLYDDIEIVNGLTNHSRESMTLKKLISNSTNTPISGEPSVTPSQTFYPEGSVISISFSESSESAKDWIGIYTEGSQPGEDDSVQWSYVDGTDTGNTSTKDGNLTFSDLSPGNYTVHLLLDDSYTILASNSFRVMDGEVPSELEQTNMLFNNVDREGFWKYIQPVSPASGVWNGFTYYNSGLNAEFSSDFNSVAMSVTFDVLEHAGEKNEAAIIKLVQADDSLELDPNTNLITWYLSELQTELATISVRSYLYSDFFPDMGSNDDISTTGVIIESYEFDYPNLRMSFNTQVGSQYIIEATDNVTALGWEAVGSEEGTGDLLTIELDVTLNQEAYFRVKQVTDSNESIQSVR